MQETLEQIGFSAGQIYNYLSENNGKSTFTKMKKDLDLKGNFAELGLGWLAREDKIDITKKGASINVVLR
ncbi:MAG TPA: winged helix-turn-helix domain-containing protein [Candidatus Gastranaerophilaceae bacterium]|nr:winged helix-turn-helix domain-containing protein [Candidatus Gastranaerophilaceae bacterium]HPT41091.1 winged helix-turn-helix domain-containing protein [Candidatus Gastranaerophilaceae bacterium]